MRSTLTLLLLAALLSCERVEAASSLEREVETVLHLVPDLEAGERQYTATCIACHGATGEGQREGWAPRIAGQRFSVIAAQLVDYRRGRRWDDRMQAQASEHRLAAIQQLADVAAYASQLAGGTAERGPGEALAVGARLFADRCRECHGVRAEGSERGRVPRLAGQNYGYLVRQLHDFVEGRRLNASRDHVRRLDSLDREEITGLADFLSRL